MGDSLVLLGDPPRGSLYAVYTFLEDVVGVRWWTSTESYLPKTPTLRIKDLDIRYAPKLQFREAFYRDAFDGVFAARSKCNGHFPRVPEAYGGHYPVLGWCHTFFQLLPPDKYFQDHPEWYSEIDGQRKADHTQLCLTNEAMRAELVQNALKWLRAVSNPGVIDISQNDWHGQCQCAKCRAIEEEEGSLSGPLLRFVNAVAEDIEREFPRREGHDVGLPIHSQASQARASQEERGHPAVLDRVFLRGDAGRGRTERGVSWRYGGLVQGGPPALRVGLRDELCQLLSAPSEPAGAGPEHSLLRRP